MSLSKKYQAINLRRKGEEGGERNRNENIAIVWMSVSLTVLDVCFQGRGREEKWRPPSLSLSLSLPFRLWNIYHRLWGYSSVMPAKLRNPACIHIGNDRLTIEESSKETYLLDLDCEYYYFFSLLFWSSTMLHPVTFLYWYLLYR